MYHSLDAKFDVLTIERKFCESPRVWDFERPLYGSFLSYVWGFPLCLFQWN